MATQRQSVNYNNEVKEVKKRGKNSKKKSLLFVPLDGMSQSAKDRCKNDRPVRLPKNINLVEGDPVEDKGLIRKRDMQTFPSEHLLSSKIKEVNGMDYSNEFIEQHYRNFHSRSDSPGISEDSTNSLSIINDSAQSSGQKETSTTGNESSNMDSPLAANNRDVDHQVYTVGDDNYDPHFVDTEGIDDFIRGCRYSKNAAIIGLLKNKMISVDDLESDTDNRQNSYPDNDPVDAQYSLKHKNVEKSVTETDKGNSTPEFDPKSNDLVNYANLVPHPDDSDFYTHPLQAYGKVNDEGVDYSIGRIGTKDITTPRQFFISEGLDEAKFKFERKSTEAPKPKLNINLTKINSSKLPTCNENDYNAASSHTFIPLPKD